MGDTGYGRGLEITKHGPNPLPNHSTKSFNICNWNYLHKKVRFRCMLVYSEAKKSSSLKDEK